jgi:hypothetical protein
MLLPFFPIVADAISTTADITSVFDSLDIRDSGCVALQFHKNIVFKSLPCTGCPKKIVPFSEIFLWAPVIWWAPS